MLWSENIRKQSIAICNQPLFSCNATIELHKTFDLQARESFEIYNIKIFTNSNQNKYLRFLIYNLCRQLRQKESYLELSFPFMTRLNKLSFLTTMSYVNISLQYLIWFKSRSLYVIAIIIKGKHKGQ